MPRVLSIHPCILYLSGCFHQQKRCTLWPKVFFHSLFLYYLISSMYTACLFSFVMNTGGWGIWFARGLCVYEFRLRVILLSAFRMRILSRSCFSLIRGGELSMCLTFSQPEGLTSSVFVHTWLLGNCWRDLAQRREPLSIYLITSQSGDGWTLSHCHVVLALYSWGHKPRNFSLRPSAPPHLRFPESLVFKWIYVLRRGRVNLGKFKPQGNSFSCTVIKIYVESVATGSKNRSR